MKKFTPLILYVLCVLILLSSCGKAEKYEPMTAYIASGTEGVDNVVRSNHQYRFISEEDVPEPQDTSISATIMGTTYVAEYERKSAYGATQYQYVYKTAAGDRLTLNSDGDVVYFENAARTSLYMDEVDPNDCISAETALAKASEYLVQIVGAEIASKYAGELPDIWCNAISVNFKKINPKFSGYNTNESITIEVSVTGDFYGYKLDRAEQYEDKTIPSDFNDDKIIELIRSSLNSDAYSIELSSYGKSLIILADGRLACTTCFRLVENGVPGEWADVMIPLE